MTPVNLFKYADIYLKFVNMGVLSVPAKMGGISNKFLLIDKSKLCLY